MNVLGHLRDVFGPFLLKYTLTPSGASVKLFSYKQNHTHAQMYKYGHNCFVIMIMVLLQYSFTSSNCWIHRSWCFFMLEELFQLLFVGYFSVKIYTCSIGLRSGYYLGKSKTFHHFAPDVFWVIVLLLDEISPNYIMFL